MSKSSGFGRGRSADVNVINPAVRRSSLRMAKTAFIASGVIGWALSVVVLADLHVSKMMVIPPVAAIFLAILPALLLACVVFVLVWIWPVLRVLLHWWIEIAAFAGLLAGVTGLASVVPGRIAALAAVAVLATVLLVPWSRAWIWCVISRHRIRMSFAAYLRGNREGTLPLILHAKPTPVGERVWVWLRPGVALRDLQTRTDQLAVSCWSHEVQVADEDRVRYAALVRFDIKRHNTLRALVQSPLAGVPAVPARAKAPVDEVTELDLADITEASVTEQTNPTKPAEDKPAVKKYTPRSAQPAVVMVGGEDVSDYID